MSVSAPAASKAGGLSNVLGVIAAPSEAFESLGIAPTWGWAFVIALVLMLAGAYLQSPGSRHMSVAITQHMAANSTLLANMSDADKQKMIERAGKPSVMSYVMQPVILFLAVFLNTLVMLAGNAAGKGTADFKRLWAGSMNIAVPTMGIGLLVTGIIMAMKGPDAFNSTVDMLRVIPGLGMLASGLPPVAAAFFGAITVFTLWGVYLNATMLQRMAKTSAGVAWTFAVVVLLLGAAVSAAGAAMARGFGAA